MTRRVNHESVFKNFYVRTNGGGHNECFRSYLFGCFVFDWGGGKGDSLRGEEFCGKNLLIIYVFCNIEVNIIE